MQQTRRILRAVVGAGALAIIGATHLAAQLPILLEGVADGEFWSTTKASNLLTRNAGRPGGVGRLNLWGAVEPVSRFVIYAQGDFEGGGARTQSLDDSYHAEADQFGIRVNASRALVLDVGKLQPVIGTFASRRFSNRNPLIGTPDGYSLQYSYGAMVSGEWSHFDYRAAVVDLPASHVNYVPTATRRFRPAVGAGFTPMVGLRIGGSFTAGSYLNDDYTAVQLRDQPWSHYMQRVGAADLAFARGYLETHFEAARGTYEVPGRPTPIMGFSYYGEAKYTLAPRFFVAARAERNKYPFIRANATGWTSRLTDFVDGEVGAGYRLTPNTLLKTSVRSDRWWVAPGATGFRGLGGTAVAVQLSQTFDALGWFERER